MRQHAANGERAVTLHAVIAEQRIALFGKRGEDQDIGHRGCIASSPFVSSEVETPIVCARPMGISTSLDANGKEARTR